jgi:hypothetical protein
MENDFALSLAARIKLHGDFWVDLDRLRAKSVRTSLAVTTSPLQASLDKPLTHESIDQLLYCASVFSQAADEENRKLAQDIALSAIVCANDANIRERATTILADIGNFPSVDYVDRKYPILSSTLLSQIRWNVLRTLNSVNISGRNLALTDFQYDVWSSLGTSNTVSISAPTSGGKSFLVVEYLCQRALRESTLLAVYVAPTRALLAEIYRKIAERVSEDKGIRVSTVPALDPEKRSKQIFVLTQERLHVLLAQSAILADVAIVDEAQNIADGPRGMILQDCLERLREENESIQIFMLSPGASGFEEIGREMGIESVQVKQTLLSPVLQNRIAVATVSGHPKRLLLSLLSKDGAKEIGEIATKRGMADPGTRLAAVALELGIEGAALIYAPSPLEAEKVAAQLAADLALSDSKDVTDLSAFIKEHIYPEYGLADMVRHGVAFHYGRMPTLLREALEGAFRVSALKYLVCTTTLFQGVNLPARSVFISTPTRGKGTSLDPAHLWNFAGRAGRLGQDLVGNVFLVDYDKWVTQDLSSFSNYNVVAAFSSTVETQYDSVVKSIKGEGPKPNPRDQTVASVRAAAGLMLARASANNVGARLARVPGLSSIQRRQLEDEADSSLSSIALPTSVLENNWTVDLFGLSRLAIRMREKIADGKTDDLIPLHPRDHRAYDRYSKIFSRIARQVLGYKPAESARYGGFVATYAVPWMKGVPYPILLRKWVDFQKKKKPKASINDLVRSGFEFLEDVMRFQMVQLGKAYIDVLSHVLSTTPKTTKQETLFDYSLALELGVSTATGRSLIELGLSRISAVALEALIPDSELSVENVRKQLRTLDLSATNVSPIIVGELVQLKLVEPRTTPVSK